MKSVVRGLWITLLATLGLTAPALGQYLWMDANGDGVNTAADVMNPNGTPTSVDVWINTAHDKDGAAAVCKSSDPDATLQTWNSFATHINASGGAVTFTDYTNQVAAFTIACSNGGVAFNANSTEMAQCQATGTPVGNGGVNIKLFTVTVTGQTGTPSLAFTPSNSLDNNPTSFGSACGGLDFDNTIKLGSDFMDADGIGPGAGGNSIPIVNYPVSASGIEGQTFTLSASATDTDATDNLLLTATGQPASVTLTPGSGVSPVTATLNGTLGFGDQGSYPIVWSVTDGHNPALTATTNLTVANVDRAPVVTAPATASGAENTLITYTVSAADPDGDAILSLAAAPLPSGASFTANATKTAATFSWTPSLSQSGSYNVMTTATNALSGSATTAITVTNSDRAPLVTAPATVSGASNSPLTFTVTASDPDADAITSLTAAPLPAGATFTDNATHTSGTFSWTPTNAQTGTFNVTFTTANALTGSATTAITILPPGDAPPVVAAPLTASGDENTNINFTVSATDPDSDPIASLMGTALPSGATFTANATNTTGTFDWMPSFAQSGSYNVTFTVTNALIGSATTAISVNNVDRVPVVTAPATASGDEGTLISFTVTVSDPDGEPITSLTGAPLPSSATFTANSSNTSGAFTWTPSATQSGVYNVTFTAQNALSGSASTEITVNNVDAAPVVTAPATQSVSEGANTISFTVEASDPDGDAITSLTATGTAITAGATFTANASNTSGTFSWEATIAAGSYSVTFMAANALSGSATTAIMVTGVNHDPFIGPPGPFVTEEGSLLTFGVLATDINGDHVSLSALGVPSGGSFSDNGDNTGTFRWTPGFDQAGSYTVTFQGSDGNGGTCTATTTITVNDVNRAPTADASGPYTGVINVAIVFDGSGSSDPDGDTLTYGWDFGDGGTGSGVNPSHAYIGGGTYTVTLTIYDPGALSSTATTTATVSTGGLGPIDLTTAGATYTGADGVIWTQLAEPPIGFGMISPINRLAAPSTEQGLNTDGSGAYDNVVGPWTRSLGIAELGTVRVGGNDYFSLTLDINELSSAGGNYLSLNRLALITAPYAAGGALTSLEELSAAGGVLRYDLDATGIQTVYMDASLDTGTGYGDVEVLIPTSYFVGASSSDYLYVYSRFGGTGLVGTSDFGSSDGFEEWRASIFLVPPPNLPPVVSAAGTVSVEELGELSYTITASDPDGTIASLTADLAALPAGNDASFAASPDNTNGTLVWHPTLGTAGAYPVTFTAADNAALTASVTTSIQVLAVGATVVGNLEWQPAPPDTGSFTVTFTAEDAEGLITTASTLITVLPELGGAMATVMPHAELSPMRGPIISVASTATVRAGNQLSLVVSVYPDLSAPLARSSPGAGMAPSGPTRGPIISLTANTSELPVTNPATFTVDSDPVLTCPSAIVTEPNQFVTFTVSASDPDGDPLLTLEADLTVLPQGAGTFASNSDHTSGTFAWTPQSQDVSATPYAVTFTVANVLYVSATTEITVRAANHAPVADAGGPYSGYVGAPFVFDGTKSSDPDGDALQYSWDFGDGTSGVGLTPSHTYAATLSGQVRLLVTDPGSLSGRDSASIDVRQSIETRTFTWGGNKVLRLRSGRPSWCVQIEPVSFQVSDIDVSSIMMRSAGTGSLSEITSTNGKTGVLKDSDGNGVMELTACFRKEDLVLLFSGVTGRRQVPVEIAGRLVSGATFLARLTIDVVGSSGTLAASVAPNPFNPSTTLSFETPGGGAVDLRIFDLAGRLVRDVTRGGVYPPGIHGILIDGRDEDGHRLTSGIYFYRLSTPEGSVTGRLVLLQ